MSFLLNPYQVTTWNPLGLSPYCWFDASVQSSVILTGGKVSQWSDLSGNNRHVLQSDDARRPTYSSGQFIDFPGGSVILDGNFLLSGQKPYSPVTVIKVFRRIGSFIFTSLGYIAATGGLVIGSSSIARGTLDGRPNLDTYLTTASGTPTTTRTMVMSFLESSQMSAYVNGGQTSRITTYSNLTNPYYGSGTLRFGNASAGTSPGTPAIGEINEFMLFYRKLSLSEQYMVEGYLAHKWGLVAELPLEHPYKNTPPMF